MRTKQGNDVKKAAIRRLHAAIAATGDEYVKDEIKAAYGVKSTTEMTLSQLREATVSIGGRAVVGGVPIEAVRVWRSKVLAELQAMGITAENGDFSRVNDVLNSQKVAGKLLYEMSIDELKSCFRRLKMWHTKDKTARASVQKLLDKVWENRELPSWDY